MELDNKKTPTVDGSELPRPTTVGMYKTVKIILDIYHINWWTPDLWTVGR